MRTNFTPEQLLDPQIEESEKILRKCVHCGFCTATCPTFALLGDELDSPRGRIYLIKDVLENNRPIDDKFVKHIDRCLSCLSCMTTCPSGVNYMHLIDHARSHIEKNHKRPFVDRLIRTLLVSILPFPKRFRVAILAGRLFKPFARLFALGGNSIRKLGAMLEMVPNSTKQRPAFAGPGEFACSSKIRKGRVALMSGCVQPILNTDINDATVRLLNRVGYDVVMPLGENCCGALVHHMGRENESHLSARRNIDAWWQEISNKGLDAIIITASGCGTVVKDYGHLLRNDPDYAKMAAKISGLTKDITEFLNEVDLGELNGFQNQMKIAYHSACSMQHGQKITDIPKNLLSTAGFTVLDVPEGHMCCGSAGTYNITQPEIATELRKRKVGNIEKTGAELVSTGNIGCMIQLENELGVPIVHTVELLDWAYGGPKPKKVGRCQPKKSNAL